jgi:metallophosphoesterase (TIGR00282 family)
LRILVIGDIVGKPGRNMINLVLPGLRSKYNIDVVIANGENAAHGLGITVPTAYDLLDSGVDVITTGNHIWAKREIEEHLDGELPIIRPLNYPPNIPGRGFMSVKGILVVNLMGRVFMGQFDCPFRTMDSLLTSLDKNIKIIVVDFHAEATSEKIALGKYLDGRITALLGTHTHVGTIDTSILPGGMAYVTDIGMVGPEDSVIGDNTDSVIHSFVTGMPHRLSVGKGRAIFNAVLVDADEKTGKATHIERIILREGD